MDPAEHLRSLGYRAFSFESAGVAHDVFEKGSGAPVLVMHELPGLAQPVLNFADRLVAENFRVFLPHLFGPLFKSDARGNSRALCVSAEFARLEAGVSAPIADWLRALAQEIALRTEAPRVGVIGMCLTGAFVIPLVIEPCVAGGIVSQPAIPYRVTYWLFGLDQGDWMSKLNVSNTDLKEAAQCARTKGKRILVQRFEDDRLCPDARVARIKAEFGEQAEVFEYSEPRVLRRLFFPPHSLLTAEYDGVDGPAEDHSTRIALRRVVSFLNGALSPAPS